MPANFRPLNKFALAALLLLAGTAQAQTACPSGAPQLIIYHAGSLTAAFSNNASNSANAVKFLQLLFSSQGVALQEALGPAPVRPPQVRGRNYERLPASLRTLVTVGGHDTEDH